MNRHIRNIRIKDFQNHQDTFMEFKPGLNVITGTSDSGKSAIYRALNVVYQDSWRKHDVRDGQKNSEITINFWNGDYIKRIKGAVNEIEYQVEGQPTQFRTKFSKTIPKDVLDFIGNIPKTSNSALPFANQEDKLFIINSSDATIPKDLSILLGVDDLEEAASNLSSENLKISGDIKRINVEIESTKTKLEPFEDLDVRIANQNQLKDLISEYEKLESDIKDIEDFYNDYVKLRKQIIDCEAEKEKSENLESFFNKNIPILTKQYNEISDGLILIENISSIIAQSKNAEKKYNHYYEIAEGELGQLISECDKKHIDLLEIQSLETSIEDTAFEIDTRIENIDRLNTNITSYDEEIENLEKYIRDNFEGCSTCGRFCTCQRL